MKQNRRYLNTLYCCCSWKAWAASAQSFTLCQQATTEITRSLLMSPLVNTINCSLASQTLQMSLTKINPLRSLYYCLFGPYIYGHGFLRCFRDPNWGPRIENRVPRIRENYHRIPTIRENQVSGISCWKRNWVPTCSYRVAYLTFSLKKTVYGCHSSRTSRS